MPLVIDTSSILLTNAVNCFASLPGVGRKTAMRYVLHLLRQSEVDVDAFASTLIQLKHEVKYCRVCHNIADQEVCPICSSVHRDHQTICVVENIRDVIAIENTGQYNGVYHVLGGIISPMDGIAPKDIEIDSLITRVETALKKDTNSSIEVILALPTTMEGDTTNFYIYRRLHSLQEADTRVRVTQLARGIAVGNDLEYTDDITLGRSVQNRIEFKA